MALRTPAFNDAKSYGFEWLRAIVEAGLQEGVLGAGDFKVTAAGAGGMRVDVPAGTAFVKGDSGIAGTGLTQGLFYVVNDAAIANAVTLAASDATNPRLDQIVLRVRDSSDLGSGADDAVLEVVQGVATAGATLDNRTGAAALPSDRLRLADVLVPAASVAVTAGNIRDRRPWARGYYNRQLKSSFANRQSSAYGAIDQATLQQRVECVGNPLRFTFRAQTAISVAPADVKFTIWDSTANASLDREWTTNLTGGAVFAVEFTTTQTFAAGSRVFYPVYANSSSGFTNANAPTLFVIEELLRQDAANG